MSNADDRGREPVTRLKRIRDELALEAHLGAAASETASNVGEALKLAAEELRAGYERYRSRS